MNYTILYRLLLSLAVVLTIVNKNVFAADSTKIKSISSTREIVFSGITWKVRSGTGNPGGNNWSDSSESVWVDQDGILHLKIRKENNTWYCSEIYSDVGVGYGEYRFYVASNVEELDKNVVAGFFTYLNDKNEIDIEFSKWGNATATKMGNYATQPAKTVGNSLSFDLGLNGSYSTHRFIWKPESIDYKSWHGHDVISNENTIIQNWNYSGLNIPFPGEENLIINFWLFKGNPPSDGNDAEILVKSVTVNKPPVVNDSEVTVSEDMPVSTVIDSLITPGYIPAELNFSIIEGNDLGLFSISKDGKLILENNLDYESTDFHALKIIAAKGDMRDTAIFLVHVENVIELASIPGVMEPGFKIYPNPVNGELKVDLPANTGYELCIFGTDGKRYPVNKNYQTGTSVSLNTQNLKSGNYLLLISNDTKKFSVKFQKK